MLADEYNKASARKDYKGKTDEELHEIAYSEVVAQCCETLLSDTDAVSRLASQIKAENKTLWDKICEFFRNLAEALKNAYEGLAPGSEIANQAKDTIQKVERLRDLWASAGAGAIENYRSGLTPGVDGTVVNDIGEPVAHATEDGSVQLSIRTYEEGKRDSSLSSIVDEIQKTIPRTEAEILDEEVTQADRDLESEFADSGIMFSERVSDKDTLSSIKNQKTKEEVKYSDSWYGGIREVLGKKGLDELSKRYGSYFPLSASFDATMRADNTPLVMETVQANSIHRNRKDSAFKVGRKAFISTYGISTSVHIDQMNIDAELYADVANESISKAIGKSNEQSTLDVIPHIREILSNSILMGIERIVHTGNKGTALYGYRLYNLYWYKNGKVKTPHALVCTVVQDLNKAEGYVFQNIENVTIDRGLPGTNAGMSSSVNDDRYTVAQLYRTVKKIDRVDGGLKYTDDERDRYLFGYTERNDGVQYSDRNDGGMSNRQLLANALESSVQHEAEAKRLAEYKENIRKVSELQMQLGDLNNQIKELSFAKGIKDTKKIRELRDEKIKTENRINVIDGALLRLESMQAIKNVLERERERIRKYAVRNGKAALDAYRKSSEKKQSEIIDQPAAEEKPQRAFFIDYPRKVLVTSRRIGSTREKILMIQGYTVLRDRNTITRQKAVTPRGHSTARFRDTI